MPYYKSLCEDLLRKRQDTQIRSALRHAISPRLDHMAYPYLAYWWKKKPHLRRPVLLLGYLMAEYHRVGHDKEGAPIGQVARQLCDQGAISENSMSRGILSVQRGSVDKLGQTLRRILQVAQTNGVSVDWCSVVKLCLYWDTSDMDNRYKTRRRLLEDFYKGSPEPELGDEPQNAVH